MADPQQEARTSRQELVSAAGLAARLHQNAYDRFEDAASEYVGVNRSAMRCMDVLERVGRLTPGEIATQTGLTSGAVTALLDRLERVGYVRRMRDPDDRRRIWVELTDKARQVAGEVYGPLVDVLDEYEKYSDEELQLITRYIERGSELLLEFAARIEEMRRRRDSIG
ncbi:MAG TPA: MarR family transcriptional regulator [Streptosporangiaceae bacterium]|nr:MarR family transcriptional regulator [Streptosporangiaceae bacterium]